jgi:TatD DNase family protein
MEFTDTHCHIHSSDYGLDPVEVLQVALDEGVTRVICVGENLADSKLAINFVKDHDNTWATVGIHPHEAEKHVNDKTKLDQLAELTNSPKVVAIGECGLDYYYLHSPKALQQKLLRFQMEMALAHNLPVVFHVREAFEDFWSIFDDYQGLRGVVHSFSAGQNELDDILARGLYVGINGIVTFSKSEQQLKAIKAVPLERMVLETDAPFLTPAPYRGIICQPKHVRVTANFLAVLRSEELADIAVRTTANSVTLFGLS